MSTVDGEVPNSRTNGITIHLSAPDVPAARIGGAHTTPVLDFSPTFCIDRRRLNLATCHTYANKLANARAHVCITTENTRDLVSGFGN